MHQVSFRPKNKEQRDTNQKEGRVVLDASDDA